jgi:hypothetical protein
MGSDMVMARALRENRRSTDILEELLPPESGSDSRFKAYASALYCLILSPEDGVSDSKLW